MVLDGAIDPSLDPIEENLRQMAGFQTAFDDYAADCAQSTGCPLGTDPTQFVNRYHQLVDPLVRQPAATSDPRGLSYQDAITGSVNALYSQRIGSSSPAGCSGCNAEPIAGDLLLLADDYQNRSPSGHYQNSQDAFYGIRCVNAQFPTDPAVWVAADQRSRQAAPFLSLRILHRVSLPAMFARCGLCRRRRRPTPPSRRVRARSSSSPPPTTRPRRIRPVSTWPGSWTPSLITFDGTQHTVVFNGDACVDSAVVAFLVDGVQPPAGLRC